MIFKKTGHQHGVSKRVLVLAWLSIVGWTCLIAALVVFHYARPEQASGVMKYFGIEVRTTWIAYLRFWYQWLLLACAGISIVSLLINRIRIKHHSHRLRYNVVILLLISTAMLISFFVTS